MSSVFSKRLDKIENEIEKHETFKFDKDERLFKEKVELLCSSMSFNELKKLISLENNTDQFQEYYFAMCKKYQATIQSE